MHVFLCDFLLDIAQNSFEAGAAKVGILIDEAPSSVAFRVEDDGKGMDEETLRRVSDPFCTEEGKHRRRKVGLGIPFVRQTASRFDLVSTPGKGTRISFAFDLGDIDTPPLGDLPSTLLAIISGAPDGCQVEVDRRMRSSDGRSAAYAVSRLELVDALGELQTSGSQNLALMYLRGQEEEADGLRSERKLRITG